MLYRIYMNTIISNINYYFNEILFYNSSNKKNAQFSNKSITNSTKTSLKIEMII